MAEDFRKLRIWQEAFALALEVYKLTKQFPKDEQFSLTDQIRRASTSVSANIAEGCGRYAAKDKVHFMMIARGSIFETRNHLSIALGLSYIKQEIHDATDVRYESLVRSLNAFVASLRAN